MCSVVLKPVRFAAALSGTGIIPSNRFLRYAATVSDVLICLKVFSGEEIADTICFWSLFGVLSNVRVSVSFAHSQMIMLMNSPPLTFSILFDVSKIPVDFFKCILSNDLRVIRP